MENYFDQFDDSGNKGGNYFDQIDPAADKQKPKPTRAQLARESGRQMPSWSRGFLTAMQGPTLGLLDEFRGAIYGADKFFTTADLNQAKQAYIENRDLIRGMEEQQRKEYPTLSTLTSLAASAPVFVMTQQAKLPGLGTGAAGNMTRAAVNAAPLAALAAAGAAEGDASDIGSKIATDTLAAMGMGAGMTGIGQAGMGIWRAGRGATSTKAAQQIADEKVAEALLRDAPGGSVFTGGAQVRKPGGVNAAGTRLPDIVEPYGTSSPLARMEARAGKLGSGALLADVGDRNTFRLLDVLAESPGTTGGLVAREARARAIGRGDRLAAASDEVLGKGGWFGRKSIKSGVPVQPVAEAVRRGGTFAQNVDDMTRLARDESAPYYAALQDATVPVDDNIRNILQSAQGNLSRAERILKYEGRFDDSLRGALKQEGGQVRIMDMENVKRALYDAAQELKRKGASNEARAIDDLRKRLITTLEQASPKIALPSGAEASIYRLANDSYAGPAQLKDAMELGRKSLSPDKTGEIAADIGALTKGERDAFNVGVVQAVRDLAGDPNGQTRLINFFKSPNMRERLKQAFGPDYREFASKLLREEQLGRIGKIGGGSQTFARLMQEADLGKEALQDMAGAVASVKTGNTLGAMGHLRNLYTRVETPEPVRNEIGRILMLRGDAAKQKLGELAVMMEALQRQRIQASAGLGVGSAVVAPQLTRGMNQPQNGE